MVVLSTSETYTDTIMLIRGLTMCMMASLSLVGNISVIVATSSSPFLHTPSHVLVAFLCFFHLMTAALSMVPIGISCLTEQWIGGVDDGFNGLFCQMFSITVVLLTIIPFNLLVVISIDKFTAVKYPLQYNRIITKKTVFIMVMSCTLIPIAGLVPLQMILLGEDAVFTEFYLPYGSCQIIFNSPDCVLCYVLYGIFTAFQVIPLLAIVVFYSLIFLEVKKQVRSARAQSLDKKNMLDCHKATVTIFLLVLTYILTWLPEWSTDFLSSLGVGMEDTTLYNIQIASRWIFFLSPVADPYIYALRHNKVQHELKRLICPHPTTINKPDSKSWDAPFANIRKLFTYQPLPSYHSDVSNNHVHVGTRTSSIATSEGSKRPSVGDVSQHLVKNNVNCLPESIV